MLDLLSLGSLLVEIMRPKPDLPLYEPHPFVGPFPSGAAANTISAAACLGWKCAFIGVVGEGPFGQVIYNRLLKDGVNLRASRVDPEIATGVAFVSYNSDGSRTFTYNLDPRAEGVQDEQIAIALQEQYRWVYFSGSSIVHPRWRESCNQVLTGVLEQGGRFAFDPNLRIPQEKLSYYRLDYLHFIARSTLFLPNEEEMKLLFPKLSLEKAVESALQLGPEVVVVKQGEAGCIVADKKGSWLNVPGMPVAVVDPTGAGDVFNAAFMYAYQKDIPLVETARFANVAAALSTLKLGPMEGCPTREEVYKFVATFNRS